MSVATLYSNANTATGNPAVTVRSVGSSGGTASAFTYDLARSIVYTRQGNPAWSGQERDGVQGLRSSDLFFGGAQADWINHDKVAIPQADEQQRLLANLIYLTTTDRMPLPRFWYLPRGLKAAVVLTGDDHAINGTAGRFNILNNGSPAGCSVDDWQCLRATSYIYPATPISPSQADAFAAQGFELGVHIRSTNGPDECNNFTASSLEFDYQNQLAQFAQRFPDLPTVVTNRTHCILWSDYTTQAEVALAHGIRLDTNYYWWPASWVNNRPGVFTGSGFPMRFAKTDGSMIDVYQATSQMTDESGQSFPFTADTLLDRALGPEGYYGTFVANMHTDFGPHAGSEAIVASAQARGVPVISAKQLLNWVDGRNGSAFQNLSWSGGVLSFGILVGTGANGLEAMLPTVSSVGPFSSLTRNGQPVTVTIKTIKGQTYATFRALGGNYQATYTADLTPPQISGVGAVSETTSADISWTTSEPATSVVNYGTSPGSLTQSASVPGLSVGHTVTLSGLVEGTTYFYRVTSADASGNGATAPATPASFTTHSFEVGDTTLTDFAAGTASGGVYLAQNGDGEVTLGLAVGSEFSGTALPAGWSSTPWTTGGSATVSGGALTVDGARVQTDDLFDAGRVLEFAATFTSAPFQHAGFGISLNETPWAIFSTGSGGSLFARTHDGGSAIDTPIPGSWLNSLHVYRIEWNSSTVVYSIDGSVVATHNRTIPVTMRPIASDANVGDTPLRVEWMRLGPYAASGTFTSRVLDAGSSRVWRSMLWTADVPGSGALSMSARFGNSAVPDGTWTAFTPVSYAGGPVSATSRYVQYRAILSGTPTTSPVLMDVAVSISAPAPDTIPPAISAVAVTPGTGSAVVIWTTSEPSSSVVRYGLAPGSLTQTAAAPGLVTDHSVTLAGLLESTTYFFRVTSADSSGNSATAPASPMSFSTGVTPTATLTDTTDVDFAQGSADAGVYVARNADGELILAPQMGQEFNGSTIPAGWTSAEWVAGGGGAVGAGVLSVDGGRVSMNNLLTPGRKLEFSATFGSAPFQHAGLAVTFNEPIWAIFSTGSGGQLYTRTNNGGFTVIDTPLGSAWLNAPHVYGINWESDSVVFSIDGVTVATHATGIPDSMRPIASDAALGDGALAVQWMRLAPYANAGSFTSRVLDAGGQQTWESMTWAAQTPAGTSVSFGVRFGNTPVPDETWTSYAPVPASGSNVSGASRYAQYTASLTGDGQVTPSIASVTIAAFAPPPSVSVSDVVVAEGQSATTSANFTVSLSRVPTQQVSVTFATANGTATAGADYTAVSIPVVFDPGVASQVVTVPVTGDTTFEPDETFVVNLSSVVNATMGRSQGSGEITNDDPVPSISLAGVSLTEGNSGTKQFGFVATLSNPSSQTITVSAATAAGTATAGSDYTTTSGTLTFSPGLTQQTFNVPVSGDTVLEGDEMFVVNLSSPTNATIAQGQAAGTILNDEPLPTLSINSPSVTEGTTTMTFTVTLSPANPTQTVTVSYATSNGTATAGSDYTSTSNSLSFSPGQTSRTFTVQVLGDSLDEANETFLVTLSNASNAQIGTAVGTGTINDNDTAPAIDISNVSVTEGNAGSSNLTFTITLDDPSGQSVSVNYATANGSAIAGQDYTATSGALTFNPGQTSLQVNVPILGDTLDEDNETFVLNLSGAVNATIDDNQATGTINDNDNTPSLSIAGVSVTEGDPGNNVSANFVVTLSAASGRNVTVNFTTSNGSATAGSDYSAASGTATIPAGSTSQTIPVVVLGDLFDEPNETFTITLSSPSNATIQTGQGTGTATINDNDPVSLQIDDRALSEGTSGPVTFTFTVTLSAAAPQTVTVNYATADGSATAGVDYVAAFGTLTFSPGTTSRTVNVTVLHDSLDEANETFFVNLSGGSGANIGDAQGVGTINDNDPTPSLSINNVSATEGNAGTKPFNFTVTLSAVSGQTVTVEYSTSNGSATGGTSGSADYIPTSGTLTFNPGGPTTQTVTVLVRGDTSFEFSQTFNVNLDNATNANISDDQGVGTIQNDD
jgi:hypothetical protein